MAWVTLIAGPRASGKTWTAKALAESALSNGKRVIIFEEYRVDDNTAVFWDSANNLALDRRSLVTPRTKVNLDYFLHSDACILITFFGTKENIPDALKSRITFFIETDSKLRNTTKE